MTVDPASIPQHVVDAALNAYFHWDESGPWAVGERVDMGKALAAAVTALMDDEPVEIHPAEVSSKRRTFVTTRRNAIAAVLARATPKDTP